MILGAGDDEYSFSPKPCDGCPEAPLLGESDGDVGLSLSSLALSYVGCSEGGSDGDTELVAVIGLSVGVPFSSMPLVGALLVSSYSEGSCDGDKDFAAMIGLVVGVPFSSMLLVGASLVSSDGDHELVTGLNVGVPFLSMPLVGPSVVSSM